jgi:hypothetical protein
MSRQITSTEFRVTYHVLSEPVEVTVLGRVIGHYVPTEFGRYWEPAEEIEVVEEADEEIDYGRLRIIPKEEL